MTKTENVDVSKIIKRLELIKSLIFLEEEVDIDLHVTKLEQQPQLPTGLQNIIRDLKNKSYSKALMAIDTFVNQHHKLTKFIEPEVEALKVEIRVFAAELNSLSDEKADLEKLIHEFGVRHNYELGEILLKILQHRKDKAKGTLHEKEAEEEFQTYEQQFDATEKQKITILTEDELRELKINYRKASKLCHPDVVSEEQKELATKLFTELSNAYEKNNLAKVTEILVDLEKGNFFVNKSDVINEKQLLQDEMKKLRLRIKELKEEINFIKESNTYKTIICIDNWDDYFAAAKSKLQSQLNDLVNGE